MKIEIIRFQTYKQEVKRVHLQHWSNEDYKSMEKMTTTQCITYLEDYISQNNMRIFNVGMMGGDVVFTLIKE